MSTSSERMPPMLVRTASPAASQPRRQLGVATRLGVLRAARDRERRGREFLDDAVVQRGGDPAPFVERRRPSNAATWPRVAGAPAARVPRSVHTSGHHQHDDRGDAAQRDAGETAPELGGARADLVVAEVGLEQQRFAARRPHRPIDLEQRAATALEAVLRRGQVADLGARSAARSGRRVRRRRARTCTPTRRGSSE